MRRTLLLLLALPLAACSGEDAPPDAGPSPDAAPDAAVAEDAGPPPDSGIPADAGPPPDSGVQFAESSCDDCSTMCPGGLCLTTSTESFCADRCDDDLQGCADGFICFDITNGEGQFFCIPPGATCEDRGVGYGTSCYGDTTGCLRGLNHCEGDFHSLGYCTIRCLETADCPTGYACLPGDSGYDVCRATYLSGAETCARTNDPAEPPCAIDADCAGLPGALCVRTDPRLPGVCAMPCARADECSDGQICGASPRGGVCLSGRCDCHASPVAAGTRDLLQEALSQVELSRCGTIWDIFDWSGNPRDLMLDPYRLSWFDEVHNEPLDSVGFARGVVADLDAAAAGQTSPAARAARMVERLAQLADRPATTRPATPPDASDPLVEAMVDLIVAAGGAADRAALTADAADVPLDLQHAVAQVVDAVRRGVLAQRSAVPDARDRRDLFEYGPAFVAPRRDRQGLDASRAAVRRLMIDGVGYGELFGGGVDVLDAIAQADLQRFVRVPTSTASPTTANFLFIQDTPVGRVAIGDGENSLYDPGDPGMDGPWALLIDLGGHDEYRVPAGGNQSADNPVSVLIDLAGDETYGYVTAPDPGDVDRLPSDGAGRYAPGAGPDEDNGPISFSQTARQGAGRMGIGVLVDMGTGRDHYQSLRLSQGAGLFGVGVLVDEGGSDVYLAEAVSQGAGSFGIGLLYDEAGDDVRRAYTMSQGFAYARAAGLLYDTEGDDQYLMDPGDPAVGGDPLYFSAQRPGRANSTLGQGFAFGRRADFSDRAFMSGGIGLLVDAAGADRYEGSIFAQGGGFWFGTGILADHGGSDTYDGLWYAMGSGAHYALGLLLEGGGNDVYGGAFPRVNVTIAAGHDYTGAFLIDESGDDTYHGSRITIGAGNLNGLGVFVDNAGDDFYEPRLPYAVGAAGLLESFELGSPRRKVQTIGLFIDAGGTDTYELMDMGPLMGRGDNSGWVTSENEDPLVNIVELGSGIDGEGDSTLHAR